MAKGLFIGPEFEQATCRRPVFRPRPRDQDGAFVTLWESGAEREKAASIAARHDMAVALCRHCPVLEVCKQRFFELQIEGLEVDGVIAGIRPEYRTKRICRGCHRPLGSKNATRILGGAVREYADHLCRSCWEGRRKRRGASKRRRTG